MEDSVSTKLVVPENIARPLLNASNSSDLEKGLEHLVEIAKSPDGRASSKNLVNAVLQLFRLPDFVTDGDLLFLSLKVLRNLCAGELMNQNAFLDQNGAGNVSSVLSRVSFSSEFGCKIVRTCLQLLGNFALAGEEHKLAVWREFSPLGFARIAEIRRRETCDPLCMVTYTCCGENDELLEELCSTQGQKIITEIVHTVFEVGFSEDWFKVLMSRVFVDKSCFASVFSLLYPSSNVDIHDSSTSKIVHFSAKQSFLLSILSDILNERVQDTIDFKEFALCVYEILRSSIYVVGSALRAESGLPTGDTAIDVIGYSLTILRAVCANDTHTGFKLRGSPDVVDALVSSGFIDVLLNLLRRLELPSTIKKAMKAQEDHKEAGFYPCPYRGFRRDIVSIIGNCAYHRKMVQEEIREKNGLLLLLQQCVIDEDNPYLREWGIWTIRNLLEGNEENQQVVADLEIQGSADLPEVTDLGLRVELDPLTGRPKLRNV